ncbi:glutamate receptor 4 [Microplitis mediator]|uniref:glutamate receptor 4 n=1 Tax=Microplitis mediator TaxID=375433 RepID=UPI0025549FAC|nr:glutamate receptor 4 [Microplitis mediator]
MRGIELMLIGIYALTSNNTIDYTLPGRYDWEVNLETELARSFLLSVQTEREHNAIPKEIKVTSWDESLYSSISEENGEYKGGGYAFKVFDIIAAKLNFKYKIVLPEKPILGNNVTGVIGMLNQSKADVAVAFIPIIPEYLRFVKFSPILDYLEIAIVLERPLQSAIGSGLLAPFSRTVWICIFVSLALVGPIIYIVTSYRAYLWGRTKKDKYSFIDCVWFAYGAILKQGSALTPEADSNRLMFASWWIFITIITSFYTANLTAFLTLSEFTLAFTSVKDVVNQHKTWSAQQHYIVDITINRNDPEELTPLRTSYKEHRGIFYHISKKDNKTEKVASYLTNRRLFIDEIQFVENFIKNDYLNRTRQNLVEKKKCFYIKMPNPVFQQNRGFAYPSNSTISKVINRELLHLSESGIIQHIESVNRPMVTYCPLMLGSTERKLDNNDLELTYQVIATGFLFSLISFLVEVSQHYFRCRVCLCCADSCTCCKTRMKEPVSPSKRPQLPLPPPTTITTVPSKTEFSSFTKPPVIPIYDTIDNFKNSKIHYVNGRDYFVVHETTGERRLVPVRSPSALLFQYNH